MSVSGLGSDLGPFLERVVLPRGWRVVYEPVVESTMDLAREAARRGWPDRSVFVCDYQTAGRGRQGRRWQAPAGQALLFTVLLRAIEPPQLGTWLASVALCEAIERLTRVEAAIKWPNDLMVGPAKLAGVLAEGFRAGVEGYVLVGCGLNVNQAAAALEPLGRAATSLRLAAGHPVHRGELLVVCLERIEAWLGTTPARLGDELRRAWEARLWGRGRVVRLREGGEERCVVIEGVAADGALLVREEDGPTRRVVAGEIVLEP